MGYRLAADTMMATHLLYIVFVVVGGLVAFRARWVLWLHVPAVVWAIYVQFIGRVCPLTAWEKRFRELAGDAGYEGGFMEHYIVPVIYPQEMTVALHLVLGTLVILINGAVYAALFARVRRGQLR